MSIYSQIIQAKNGSLIPVLQNGKTIDSRYNPQNDSIRTIESINTNCNFFVITGIASGIYIDELLKKIPNSFVIAIEQNQDDIDFLKQIPLVTELSKKQNCILCPLDKLLETLEQNYIPSFYSNMQILEQKAWILENAQIVIQIKEIINNAIQNISRDYSVQSHFGKIWQKNLLNNLKFLQNYKQKLPLIDNNKTALIVAAGPSLDSKIEYIKENIQNFTIIATDTAYSTLQKNNIFCDFVISIDAQNISHTHFLQNIDSKTTFIFDLSSNHSTVKAITDLKNNILFCNTGHPLSKYASDIQDSFINLYSGSGTVTICALDFAVKCNYKNILVLGADFSYTNNKAYTKGTYLDNLYLLNSSKINSFETVFNKLMFRVPLIKTQNSYKTTILSSYKDSFENYLLVNNLSFTNSNNIYQIKNENSQYKLFPENLSKIFNYNELINNFTNEMQKINTKNTIFDLKNEDISLLPLISWLRNIDDNNSKDFKYLLNLAYSTFLR